MISPADRGALRDSVTAKVCRIAADIFNLPVHAMTLSSSPDTIETWDSLHHVSLVLALEQTFHVQFLPEEAADMLSIERAALLTEQKLAPGQL